MGKKNRNRLQPKKNNHTTGVNEEIAIEMVHEKEQKANMRKPIQHQKK